MLNYCACALVNLVCFVGVVCRTDGVSLAAGKNHADEFVNVGGGNYNMQNLYKTGWPQERVGTQFPTEWLHSDLKNIAHPYIYTLFDNITTEGSVK